MLLFVGTALAVPLVLEHFDAAALPATWRTDLKVGKGLSFEGGGAVLTTGAKDKRFGAAWTTVEVRDAEWIKVGATLTVDVTAPTADAVCGLYVEIDGAPLLAAHTCTPGTTTVVRYLPMPAKAYEVKLGLKLELPGTVRADDVSLEIVRPELKTVSRGAFTYHWLGYDGFTEAQLVANDERWAKVIGVFGGSPKVDYWWLKDQDTVEQYSGRRELGVRKGSSIYSTLRGDTRQLVDLAGTAWGAPPVWLLDGVSVWLDGEYDDKEPRMYLRGQVAAGAAPALADLLDPVRYAAMPEATRKLAAGAFVSWVVSTGGEATLVTLGKAAGSGTSGAKAVEAALGKPIAEVEAAFRSGL